MPGEDVIYIKDILKSILNEIKKVKGKTLDDLSDVMDNQNPRIYLLGDPYTEDIIELYSEFEQGIIYARDDAQPDSYYVNQFVESMEKYVKEQVALLEKEPPAPGVPKEGSGRAYRKKFDRCVKAVRKTVKTRKGSSKESAAIAICTKSVLHTRGRTIRKYKKGKLYTQKR